MPQSTHRPWTAQELDQLRALYAPPYDRPLNLTAFAASIGRNKSNVCRKARELGLRRDLHRKRVEERKPDARWKRSGFASKEELRAYLSAERKAWLAEHGHPRGALGLKHTAATRAKLSAASRRMHAAITDEERSARGRKAAMTKIERYGTGNPGMRGENAYSRTKGGKRPDLDDRYFRSAWEANYARYLNWLVAQGQVRSWQYEPQTFVFHGETRGVISYTPDFLVVEMDGTSAFHEVKGWMDSASKTRLKRMAKHYPNVRIIVIDEDAYKAIAKWARLIEGWE